MLLRVVPPKSQNNLNLFVVPACLLRLAVWRCRNKSQPVTVIARVACACSVDIT